MASLSIFGINDFLQRKILTDLWIVSMKREQSLRIKRNQIAHRFDWYDAMDLFQIDFIRLSYLLYYIRLSEDANVCNDNEITAKLR